MTVYITDQHPRCPGTWALCASGVVVREFPGPTSRVSAVNALRAHNRVLTAAAEPGDLIPWESDAVAFIGVPTSDKRVLDDMSFREFPLDLLAQTETAYGHDGAFMVGRVDTASVNGDRVPAKGILDPGIPGAATVLRMLENDMLTRVSIDYTADAVVPEILEVDADGFPVDYLEHHVGVKMGGATLVSLSAFEDARIRLSSVYSAVVADGFPVAPPVEWFENPGLSGRTRLTVTDEGRVFGHLAPWGECHIGVMDRCVTPPRSATAYGFFALGTMRCAEGCEIPIGTIVMGTGHADKSLRARPAAEHYDNTGTAVADIAVGEDEYGIWFAGALRPGVTDEQVRALRAARLSGDWRQINGNLELVAALAVNTGGFPVYEEAVAADGAIQTVLAALGQPGEIAPSCGCTKGLAVDWPSRAAIAPLLIERADALRDVVHTPT